MLTKELPLQLQIVVALERVTNENKNTDIR